MAKKNLSKQKKMDTRVNFTPMVDMMMLLITFFMLCTTLAKPQAMQLTMPSNDDTSQLNEEQKQVTKASHTITLYLGSNDKVWYIAGLPNYDDPSCVKPTSYGKDGIEKVLNEHTTEEGINPIAKIKIAKKELDAQKTAHNSKMTEEQYQEALKKLKKGELPSGEKVPTMTVIIRPLNTATYENMVEGIQCGILHATHMFNAMSPLHHRNPGAVGAVLIEQNMDCEIICDGVHVHPELVKLLLREKPVSHVVMVTDALKPTKQTNGKLEANGMEAAMSPQGAWVSAKNPDLLLGSALTLLKALKNVVSWGVSMQDAVQMTSTNPARIYGFRDQGMLIPDYRADLTILDKELQFKGLFVGGKLIRDRLD